MNKFLIICMAIVLQSGCVNKMPLVSHAHMGHSLTTWHDTPDQEGLLTVAKKETAIAFNEAQRVSRAVNGNANASTHIDNVINALNADLQPFGSGLGYGAIRALIGAVDHMEFAASSEDASDNMIVSVIQISELGDEIAAQMEHALKLAQKLKTTDVNAAANSRELLVTLHGLASDGNSNGVSSLANFEKELFAMLARETDPPYEPVSRRYVLGLVKLPNGLWGFRLPRREVDHSRHRGYGMSGY